MAGNTTSGAPQPVTAPSSATKPNVSDDKIPKSLPPGVWSSLIQRYNGEQLFGKDRCFPTQGLMGAEVTLARMYFEHHNSKLYTPVPLGEILQSRSFQSSREVNPLAKQNKKSMTLTLEDGSLIQKDEKEWQPRSALAILDGVNACRWAMILVEWGPEEDVNRYCDWMVQRAWSRPNKTDQMNDSVRVEHRHGSPGRPLLPRGNVSHHEGL